MKPVIDIHTHLDESITGPAINAARKLNSDLTDSGVVRAVVLHLDFQRWSIEEVAEAIADQDRLVGFANVHPDAPQAIKVLDKAYHDLGYIGLKLHPRLQHYPIDSESTIRLVRHAGDLNLPVIICGFPDGDWLMQGSTVLRYAHLAKECPQTKIIVAHMGGHYVIDLMMLAKRIPNLYLDTSYSLLYYRGSAVVKNLTYAMRSMKFKRVFYGSDYPDRSIVDTLTQSVAVLQDNGFNQEEIDQLLYRNAKEFFEWFDI